MAGNRLRWLVKSALNLVGDAVELELIDDAAEAMAAKTGIMIRIIHR